MTEYSWCKQEVNTYPHSQTCVIAKGNPDMTLFTLSSCVYISTFHVQAMLGSTRREQGPIRTGVPCSIAQLMWSY